MERVYDKLVRDEIPNIIKGNGGEPFFHVLTDEEYEEALNKKLYEEVLEVSEATGKDKIEELADVYELIRTIADLHDSSIENVARVANKKKKERGSFEKKLFLEKVIEE